MKATNDFINAIEDDPCMNHKYETYMEKVRDQLYAELAQDAGKFNDIEFGDINFDLVVDYIVERCNDD